VDRTNPPRLDPRQPLVVDTRELGRRPGSMKELIRTVPAPEGLGIVDLIGVRPGADLHLDLRLESVMEGVLVTAAVGAEVTGECGRCLEPLSDTLEVTFQELYVYPENETGGADSDEDVSRMQGDLLDLEPMLRDAVVLALPVTPLCREDCEGLCVTCGERWADLPDDHQHHATDARWSALAHLTTMLNDEDLLAQAPTAPEEH
jgi:uncharacterized protein